MPLDSEELTLELPDETFVGKLDPEEFASPSVTRWLRQPKLVMKPTLKRPACGPVARINIASKGKYYRIAGHFADLGSLGS